MTNKKPEFDYGITNEAKREASFLTKAMRFAKNGFRRNKIGIPENSYMDDALLMREYYNANKFPIRFELCQDKCEYIAASGKNPGPQLIVCNPDKWVVLPHAYYKPKWPEGIYGEEVIAHFNYGEDMFKGLKPSRETIREVRRRS